MQAKIILWGLSGICLGISTLHAYTAPFLILGIFLYLYNIHQPLKGKSIFYLSLMAGTLKSMGALWWIWSLLPITWPAISTSPGVIAILAFYWISASGVIGLGLSCTTYFFIKLKEKTSHVILFLPLFWVFGEIIGSFLFSIFTWGPGSIPNVSFSYGYIGYPLVSFQLFQNIAIVGGVYALSTVAILLCGLIFYGIQYRKYTHLLTVTVAIILMLNFIPNTGKLLPSEKIAIINTNYDMASANTEEGAEGYRKSTKEAVEKALQLEPKTIILPEHSLFTSNFASPTEALEYLNQNSRATVQLIDSRPHINEEGQQIVQALIYDTQSMSIKTQEKRYLVPHGEYLPLFHAIFIHFFTPKNIKEYFFTYRNYQRGTLQDSKHILFCHESTNPLQAKLSAKDEPFFVHIVSHARFNTPSTLWHQQRQLLQTQALWSKTPIFVAANKGPHAIYHANGSVTQGVLKATNELFEVYLYE